MSGVVVVVIALALLVVGASLTGKLVRDRARPTQVVSFARPVRPRGRHHLPEGMDTPTMRMPNTRGRL